MCDKFSLDMKVFVTNVSIISAKFLFSSPDPKSSCKLLTVLIVRHPFVVVNFFKNILLEVTGPIWTKSALDKNMQIKLILTPKNHLKIFVDLSETTD